MICTSIRNKTLEEILSIVDDPYVEMAEIRADLCNLSQEEVVELIETCEKPLIICSHIDISDNAEEKKSKWSQTASLLEKAIEAGVAFIDLDINAPAHISQRIQKLCKHSGTRLIRSYHDFEGTPDTDLIRQIILRCFRYGADIAKIACTASSIEDVTRLQSFYDTLISDNLSIKANNLILISMGVLGEKARLDCLSKGAPFTYAYYDLPTAGGQLSLEQMHKAVYGEWLGVHKSDFHAPCSKSFAQRAILAAALAEGTSHLSGFSPCEDSLSAIEVARSLGAKITRHSGHVKIEGIGVKTPESLNIKELNVGQSGLLARLCIPLSAALSQCDTIITGRGTLLNRALTGANDIMAAFGILLKNEDDHKGTQVYIPLKVKGKFYPGRAEISGNAGSQLISGLLMTLPLFSANSQLFVSEPKSIPYMFITQDIAAKFGIKIESELEGDAKMLEEQDWSYCNGIYFKIKGGQHYKAADIELESDWSAAACFLTYGALFGEAEVLGLNTNSIQADITILDILSDAGACISYDETVVSVKRAPMQPFEYDLNNAPDLIPLASLIAAFCPGESTIYGVSRLKNKECNRAQAIYETLEKMGVELRMIEDGFKIKGMGLCQRFTSGNLLHGGNYSSFHDHRMVMLLSIAQMGADSPIIIDDTECINKSFPAFFEEMKL